jgi:hypothetical protein
MQIPCVYLPGPAPAVTVANINDFVNNYGLSGVHTVHTGKSDPYGEIRVNVIWWKKYENGKEKKRGNVKEERRKRKHRGEIYYKKVKYMQNGRKKRPIMVHED